MWHQALTNESVKSRSLLGSVVFVQREKLFLNLMYSFSKLGLSTCSGPAGDARMKRCSPFLTELTVLGVPERQAGDGPVDR